MNASDRSPRPQPRPLVAVLLLAAFVLLPSMASVGMFLDGTIYAAISRNLAEGAGSMWAPQFSDGLFPVFHEQPPLVFWLQSLFFRVLGDSYLTERAFDLVVVVASGILLRALWIRLAEEADRPRLAGYWWLALLCWVLVPKWSWAYRNNVLENTLTLACLASVLLMLTALRTRGAWRGGGLALLAGAATFAAFLAKGLPALFVLPAAMLLKPALPGVAWSRALALAAVQTLVTVAAFGVLLWLEPEARVLFGHWWQHQVAARTGLDAGWTMVPELIKKLVPMAIVVLPVWLVLRRRLSAGWARGVTGPAAAMLSIGFAASLPLVFGDRDSGHYLVPSLPYFALGFGLLAAALLDSGGREVHALLVRRPGPVFMSTAAAAALLIAVMCAGRIGEVRKDAEIHALFNRVAALPDGGDPRRLEVAPELYSNWALHAVAQRHYRISLLREASGTRYRLEQAGASSPGRIVVKSGRWQLRQRD